MLKKNISIITIHKGQIENLIKTLNSIDNQKVKNFKNYVISPFIPKTELKKFKKKYRKFIIGKDKSLYNAMNIGLSYTWSDYILFLNSGDHFYNKNASKIIALNLNNKCLIFKTILKFKDKTFYPNKSFFERNYYYPHPSFIRPPQLKNKILFKEKYKIDSDGYWIKKNLSFYNSKKIFKNLSVHYLGGLSTSPNINTIKYYFSTSLFNGIKEILKYLLFKLVSQKNYYQIIYKFKFNIK